MTVRTQIFFSVLAVCLMAINVQQSHAQENEAAIVQGVKQLGENWQALSRTGDVLILRCPNNMFAGVRLASGAAVSVDLQRTNSLINPYLGIVRITGRFQFSRSPQGSCLRTQSEAKRNMNWADNDRNYDYEIFYQINGTELWLTDGNEVFRNNFMRQDGPPEVDSNSSWLRAFRFPLASNAVYR